MSVEFDTTRDIQKTFGIIKPDASHKKEDIFERIIDEGFTIIRHETMQLSRERAGEFYKEHEGKSFYEKLIEYMTSGPIVVMALCKHDAVKEWRKLMGPTNVDDARKNHPTSLRAIYGKNMTNNAVHGSDSLTSARRELKFFFPKLSVEPSLSNQESKEYIQQELNAVLIQGLTKLAKEKPQEPLKWLAYWLLENNPNKPSVESTSEIVEPEE
ncbi:nucleoside diphosphate kinase [Acrasis kona]|uniref:Nucleoside diphosphate kinase n=1 Tax=Acrasis kona TaxID=1008807 RepID=A0AAW2ZG85_9EUKA